jgi:enolase
MNLIKQVHARQILDSRGNPTIEVDVLTHDTILGRASVPSGASTGKYEALELRDHQQAYLGKGVLQAISHVNEIINPALRNQSVLNQRSIDMLLIELDGTRNKQKLGANALLGVSMAIAKAGAAAAGIPLFEYLGGSPPYLLPLPLINLYNGGSHANNAADIQEFMIIPIGAASFSHALQMGVEVFHHLAKIFQEKGLPTHVGDEGGFAARLASHEAVIELILQAIEKAGFKPGEDIALALDAAASSFYEPATNTYHFSRSSGQRFTSEEMVAFWKKYVHTYPILSIEDGIAEEDWKGWQQLTQALGQQVQLVGDDLFVTQQDRLKQGINQQVANAILIKMNQVGTVSETLDTLQLAKQHTYHTIISHRSGETEDTMIADLAVATQAGQIKAGSVCRTDRTAKYNQLLRIEELLGGQASLAKPPMLKK